MFWKKDKGATATLTKDGEKAKKSGPQDVIAEQIDAVATDTEVTFKLGDIYIKPYITITRNAAGKQFTVFQDGKDEAGNPAGKRSKFWDADDSKEIAHWIAERGGSLYKR